MALLMRAWPLVTFAAVKAVEKARSWHRARSFAPQRDGKFAAVKAVEKLPASGIGTAASEFAAVKAV